MATRINPYDQPAQAQFMNTYVPIPFQEMLAAGQMKQGRYDQAANAIDSGIAALDEIQAIPNSADELRAKGYSDKMREIRDKYVGRDLSDPFVQRELSNEIHRSVNKEDIKHIQQSYQGYLGYNKMLAENAQRGVDTPAELRQNFTGYDSKDPTMGVFTGTPSMYKDPLKESEEFFNNLKPNELGSFKEKINGVETGRIGTKAGVTVERILDHADKNIEAFTKLPSIKQMIEVARKRGDDRDATVIAKEYVRAHAPEWAHIESSNYAYDPFYKERANGTKEPPVEPDTIEPFGKSGSKQANDTTQNSRKLNKTLDVWDEAGTPEQQKLATSARQQMAFASKDKQDEIDRIDNEERSALFDNAVSTLVKDYGMSVEDAVDYVNDKSILGSPAGVLRNLEERRTLAQGVTKEKIKSFFNTTNEIIGASMTGSEMLGITEKNKNKVQNYKSGLLASMEDETSKGEVIQDYVKGIKTLDKKISNLEREKEKIETEAGNAALAYQDIYLETNQNFTWDKDGKIKGTFTDKNGTSKERVSALASDITDGILRPGDHEMEFLDEDGKKMSRLGREDIKKKLDAGLGFRMVSVNTDPADDGSALVTLQVLNQGKDGTSQTSGDLFTVKYKMDVKNQRLNLVNELRQQGWNETAFAFYEGANTKDAIYNSPDIATAKEPEIPLREFNGGNIYDNSTITDDDTIKFFRNGPYYTKFQIIINGAVTDEIELPEKTALKDLTSNVNSALYNIQRREQYRNQGY